MPQKLFFILIILILGLSIFLFFDSKTKQEQEHLGFSESPRTGSFSSPEGVENMISVITIFDNYLINPDLRTGWGFSCLIKTDNGNILFDTGDDGEILLENMEKMKIDPKIIDSIVISHDHYDHFGGLADFLKQNNQVKVCILSTFNQTKNIAENTGATVLEIEKSTRITENIYTTGELGTGIKEHSLIIKTNKGLIVITGCSHPGIVNILKKARELFPEEKIYLVLGGFHLFQTGDSEIENIIISFKELGVQKVAPCHCSGDRTRELFKQEYGDDFIENGVGKIIEI